MKLQDLTPALNLLLIKIPKGSGDQARPSAFEVCEVVRVGSGTKFEEKASGTSKSLASALAGYARQNVLLRLPGPSVLTFEDQKDAEFVLVERDAILGFVK